MPHPCADLHGPVGVAVHGRGERREQLGDEPIEIAEAAGLNVTSPRDASQRGGTITVNVEHAAAVTRELIRREIIVDFRPGAGIRISPHFYTKDEELDIVVREIRRIIDTRAYEAHEATGAAY